MLTGILVVDKPQDISSHGVVARLRRITGERKCGHGGTLDPLATGVLPIFFGRATRASGMLLEADKEYIATFRLGIRTDTQDITGTVLERNDAPPGPDAVEALLPRFVGPLRQIPPMYSALKVDGKKLYEIARAGGEVERKPRDITVYEIVFLGAMAGREHEYRIRVACSKGTYIRTLIDDIGAALGCGATLTELRRSKTGCFSEAQALTLEDIARAAEEGRLPALMTPIDALFQAHPAVSVDAAGAAAIRNGALCRPGSSIDVGQCYRVYGPAGEFLMLGIGHSQGHQVLLKTVKSFFEP